MTSPDDTLDFDMTGDLSALTPEEAATRKARRQRQSDAARQRYLAAELDGQDPEALKLAARRSAARVKDLAAASTKIEAALGDLEHLGVDHPAAVLLSRALELVEREELVLAGRRRGAAS